MTKILFVCHGNVCRSPTAEFVMRDLVCKAGLEAEFEIASAAAHTDMLGCAVHGPSSKKLAEHGIDCSGKTARLLRPADYDYYDLIIGMDDENMHDMRRLFAGDAEGKLHLMMEYAGKPGAAVADPWYTGDFERTWQDVFTACSGLLGSLSEVLTLDFSACTSRGEMYAQMREKMEWEDWYGENLDAVFDILLALPHKGSKFIIFMPDEASEASAYAERLCRVFSDAGMLIAWN